MSLATNQTDGEGESIDVGVGALLAVSERTQKGGFAGAYPMFTCTCMLPLLPQTSLIQQVNLPPRFGTSTLAKGVVVGNG